MFRINSQCGRACLLATMAIASMTSLSLAGLVGGGGDTHDWTGNVSASWHNAGNWTSNEVPAAGDAVIVLGGADNVLLFGDSANVESLYVGGAQGVSNNGHVLNVTAGIATTTVSGMDGSLFVTPGGAPFGFMTDELSVENDADLDMAGGWVLINEQLDLQSGGRIIGHGYIDIDSPNPAAFNGFNGSSVTANGGNLHIRLFSGGSMALPGTLNVYENNDLNLVGDLFTDITDVNMNSDTRFIVGEHWTLGGTLSADTAIDQPAIVMGDGSAFIEGHVSVTSGSHLRFDTPANFEAASSTTVSPNATLEFNDWYSVDPGHATTLGMNGRLLVPHWHNAGGFQGELTSNAGRIEINTALGMQVPGDLTLGSLFGIRTRIEGTGPLRAMGNVDAPGLGAIVDGDLELTSTAVMTLGGNAQIIVNGDLRLEAGSDVDGDGRLTINDGGELVMFETASVHADIDNSGSFRAGSFSNEAYVYINGDYTQTATGTMRADIGGPANTDRDVYETNGPVDLAGELVVNLTDGFVPNVGDTFEIIWANGGVSGTFDDIAGDPGFTADYAGNIVTLTYNGPCPSDITGDGEVDVDDLVELFLSWGVCGACAADIDGSGDVDVNDLVQLFTDWGDCS